MDQVWSDKVKADKIQETIKTAMNEINKGNFEEIKELDEEQNYSSGFNSQRSGDKTIGESKYPSLLKPQIINEDENEHEDSNDDDDDNNVVKEVPIESKEMVNEKMNRGDMYMGGNNDNANANANANSNGNGNTNGNEVVNTEKKRFVSSEYNGQDKSSSESEDSNEDDMSKLREEMEHSEINKSEAEDESSKRTEYQNMGNSESNKHGNSIDKNEMQNEIIQDSITIMKDTQQRTLIKYNNLNQKDFNNRVSMNCTEVLKNVHNEEQLTEKCLDNKEKNNGFQVNVFTVETEQVTEQVYIDMQNDSSDSNGTEKDDLQKTIPNSVDSSQILTENFEDDNKTKHIEHCIQNEENNRQLNLKQQQMEHMQRHNNTERDRRKQMIMLKNVNNNNPNTERSEQESRDNELSIRVSENNEMFLGERKGNIAVPNTPLFEKCKCILFGLV